MCLHTVYLVPIHAQIWSSPTLFNVEATVMLHTSINFKKVVQGVYNLEAKWKTSMY